MFSRIRVLRAGPAPLTLDPLGRWTNDRGLRAGPATLPVVSLSLSDMTEPPDLRLVALHKHWIAADAVKQFIGAPVPLRESGERRTTSSRGETKTMRTRFRSEGDDWVAHGPKITALESLDAIRRCLDGAGPIIVEHWFYRGSSAPERMIFDEFEAFAAYLDAHASAGDAIHVWSFAAVCRDENTLTSGKCPDDAGLVPTRGAY
jgi:hypothetical protein